LKELPQAVESLLSIIDEFMPPNRWLRSRVVELMVLSISCFFDPDGIELLRLFPYEKFSFWFILLFEALSVLRLFSYVSTLRSSRCFSFLTISS